MLCIVTLKQYCSWMAEGGSLTRGYINSTGWGWEGLWNYRWVEEEKQIIDTSKKWKFSIKGLGAEIIYQTFSSKKLEKKVCFSFKILVR